MLKIWFMYDWHTFAKIENKTRAQMIERAKELFRQDGCGSLFVRDQWGGSLENLTLNGRRLGNGTYGVLADDIEKWADAVEAERSFQSLMV